MEAIMDSALFRMGILDTDSMPVNPMVRWNSVYANETICIESQLYPNEYNCEEPFDPDCFGMSIEDMALDALTDDEWKRMIEVLGFGEVR